MIDGFFQTFDRVASTAEVHLVVDAVDSWIETYQDAVRFVKMSTQRLFPQNGHLFVAALDYELDWNRILITNQLNRSFSIYSRAQITFYFEFHVKRKIDYSDLMVSFFDIDCSPANGDSIALQLPGDAVLVRKVNLGARGLHHFVNSSSRTSNKVRMERIRHFDAQRGRCTLHPNE